MRKKNLIIIGAGGHSRVVVDVAQQVGFNVTEILDLEFSGQSEQIANVPVTGGFEYIEKMKPSQSSVAIAIGDNFRRKYYFEILKKKGFELPPIMHPKAIISNYAVVSEGCFINAAAVINAEAFVGACCIVNTAAVVEHEVKIGQYTHIGPGAKIAGRTSVGSHVFIGMGANVADYIQIGHNCVIGAGSVIITDVPSGAKYAGIPGRCIK